MRVTTTIRRFRWEDLEELTRLFNLLAGTAGTAQAADAEYMRRFLSQPSCEPEENCYVAESGGPPVGYSILAPELPIGRAVASGGVLPSHRRQGIGNRLLAQTIERAGKLPVDRMHIQVPEGCGEGHRLLNSQGFQPVRRYWRMLWDEAAVPPANNPAGLRQQAFRPDEDEPRLVQLQNDVFCGSWGFCPNTVEQIAARVQLKPLGAEGIIMLVDDQRLAGYNWTSRCSSGGGATGKIEMMGVNPAYRGRGLGRTVALTGMAHLVHQGVDVIELEVDSCNVPARQLYLSIGFRKVEESLWYEKRLVRTPEAA